MKEFATLFEQARALPEKDRAAFLDRSCKGDSSLRQKIDRMLSAAAQADAFFGEDSDDDTDATLMMAPVPEGPGAVIGRYKLLQKIGEGGMGVVFMAEQTEPVIRKVALKIIKAGMDTRRVIARFEAERQALAMMDHPNIAHVLDAGATESGRPYFVMELVQGVPITEFCDKNKLSARERIDLFIPVCHAIQSAHQKGIIHRDIKPSNVLVTLNHGEPVPKVIDFGIAKATNQKLTEKTLFTNFATMIGTPAYMSPEQAELSSMDVDTRADVYSLGVLLYELLTGSTPFPEKRLRSVGYGEMQRIIVEEDPPKPSERLRTLTIEEKTTLSKTRGIEVPAFDKLLKGDLDWIVMKCLEKDRRRRYDGPNELAADLKRHLTNEPVSAAAPSFAYQLQKLYQRNRAAVAMAGTIATILVIAVIVSATAAIRASKAERAHEKEAENSRQQAAAAQAAQKEEAAQRLRAEQGEKKAQESLYSANISLIDSALSRNNAQLAHQLLQETAASSDRGFEWFYHLRQLHLDLRAFKMPEPINTAAVSPGGEHLVTVSSSGTAHIWDFQKGPHLLDLSSLGHMPILSVAFFPDGKRIAVTGDDLAVRILNVLSGATLSELKVTADGELPQERFRLKISSDGRRLAAGGLRHIFIFDVASAREIMRIKTSGNARHLSFSGDGKRLAAALFPLFGNGRFAVWDVETGTEAWGVSSQTRIATVAEFSPDSQRLLCAGSEGVIVRDAKNGEPLQSLWGHALPLTYGAFSSDGTKILTASNDRTARLWNAATGEELQRFKGHGGAVSWAAFASSEREVVTASQDGMAKVWAVNSQESLEIKAPGPVLSGVAFSPDGRKILAGSSLSLGKIWDAATGQELLTVSNAFRVAWSPGGDLIAMAGFRANTARVADSRTGRDVATLQGHRGVIGSISFSPDGKYILTAGGDGAAKIWTAATGKEILSLPHEGASRLTATWAPDGDRIATMSKGASIWKINRPMAADAPFTATLQTRIEGMVSMAFSGDGKRIAVGDRESLVIWDVDRGEKALVLPGISPRALAFSPDGKRIAAAGARNEVEIYNSITGREMLSLKGPLLTIGGLAFSNDGRRIAAGSADGAVRIWQAATHAETAEWAESQKSVDDAEHEQKRLSQEHRVSWENNPNALKKWLMLGPIPPGVGESGVPMPLDYESCAPAKAGATVKVANRELSWMPSDFATPEIYFPQLSMIGTESNVVYALTRIYSPEAQTGVRLQLQTTDIGKMILNGTNVLTASRPSNYYGTPDVVDVSLRTGLNTLLLITQSKGMHTHSACVYIYKGNGETIDGLEVTTRE